MDRSKIKRLFHTVKYLKPIQVYYRLYYFVRNRFFKNSYTKQLPPEKPSVVWEDVIFNPNSFLGDNLFSFLNISKDFRNNVDWNYEGFGKLWTYNLNYFDFLNQNKIALQDGIDLILDYIKNDANLLDGKEPYPISLRGINWVKFLSKNKIKNDLINQHLYDHYQILRNNLEYHLLGNHLLENGFSLLFGACYFKDKKLYKKAIQILNKELNEQILDDGAHFELSPMYHQIILYRVLDSIQLLSKNKWKELNTTITLVFLKKKAEAMLSWIAKVTFKNGNIPMVNDSAYGIAPTTDELLTYGKKIGINFNKANLSDSGYRKFEGEKFELFLDVGKVGPSYQPGHVHSDTFNFELYLNNLPVIIDTGTSTYEKNKKRQEERQTASHNTVKIAGLEQTEVWGGFRVAQRAKISYFEETKDRVRATHDGYKKIGIYHTREFFVNSDEILIEDSFSKNTIHEKVAFLHFHPNCKEIKLEANILQLLNPKQEIFFDGDIQKIERETYNFAFGFNKTKEAIKIKVYFKSILKTHIKI